MPIPSALDTPAALIDTGRMHRNIERMQARVESLGVAFRPHIKTGKSLPILRALMAAGARGVTVSTLKEADECFAAGVTDIVYAVGIAPNKLPHVAALRARGCDLKILTDNIDAATAIRDFGAAQGTRFDVWLEIDTDDHRAGIGPADDRLIAVARVLEEGGMTVGGVLTHAGASYACDSPLGLRVIAERERAGAVLAAARLREAGFACPAVSVGSTPTALSAERMDGVTEVRAGVYVFFDLVMHNVGVCRVDEIALSVLTTVIGHQPAKGWAIVDAGWMAMSRDRGTQRQARDFGYGQVCDESGDPLAGYLLTDANQEHGIVARTSGIDPDIAARFPVGTRLRILPNHACATAAQHPGYRALMPADRLEDWPRWHGW